MNRQTARPSAPVPVWKGWERTLLWEGEPALVCTVQPLALPACPPRTARYYRRLEQAWSARWEKRLYPMACAALRAARAASRPFRPWEASLSAAVTLHTEERLSLTVDAAERLDGPRAVTLRLGDAWSLPGGRPLALSELFPPGAPWRRQALAAAEKQLRARQEAGEARFSPGWERLLRRRFHPERCFLTEEGPVLFYPLFALGPYVEGMPQVSLDLSGGDGAAGG